MKYIVMMRYGDEIDAISVWDTEEQAHAERKRLADNSFSHCKFWVRATRHNTPWSLT